MKNTAPRILALVAVSALAFGSASLALARGGFGPGAGPGWGGNNGGTGWPRGMGLAGGLSWFAVDPTGTSEERLMLQRANLGITPGQEPAWNAYAEAVREKAGIMAAHRQALSTGTVTQDERFAMRQQGFARMRKLNQATQGLSAVLAPDQKVSAGWQGAGRACPGRVR